MADGTQNVRLQVIGGGKMGEALLGGLVSDGWATADELHVVEPDEARRGVLAEVLPGVSISDSALAVSTLWWLSSPTWWPMCVPVWPSSG